jgi:hypothetical protein
VSKGHLHERLDFTLRHPGWVAGLDAGPGLADAFDLAPLHGDADHWRGLIPFDPGEFGAEPVVGQG